MKMKNMFRIAGLFIALAITAVITMGRGDMYFYLNLQTNYAPDEAIHFGVDGRGISGVKLKLMKVDLEKLLIATTRDGEARDLSGVKLDGAKLVREWTEKISRERDRDWVNAEFTMKNPGPGAYVLQAESAGETRVRLFLVTGIAAVSKTDSDDAVIFVADSISGKPLTGASVKIIGAGKVIDGGASDDKGLVRFSSMHGSGDMPVLVEWDGNPAIMNYYGYGEASEEYRFYVYTDRPVYRPGQKVAIKGIIRGLKPGGDYTLPEGEAEITISDPRGDEVQKIKSELRKDGFGTFFTEIYLKARCPLGHYSVLVDFNGQQSYHAFQVEEYRKPEYEISVIPSEDTIVNGDKLSFTVEAKYYFGEPVKDAEVEYTIFSRPYYWYRYARMYEWYFDDNGYDRYYGYGDQVLNGKGRTDARGLLKIDVKKTGVDSNRMFTLQAVVTEKGRRAVTGSGSAKVMRAEFDVSVSTDRYVAEPGDKIWISASASDHKGNPVSRALTLEIVRVDWKQQKGEWKSNESRVLKRTIETDSEGKSKTPFTPDQPGSFSIRVTGADKRGNNVDSSAHVYVTGDGRRYWWSSGGEIEIIADMDQYRIGDTVKLLVNTPYESAHALVSIEGAELLGADVLNLKTGSGVYEFKIAKQHQPNVDFTVTIIRDGQLVQNSVSIVAPPVESFADITIESDKPEYQPGETAHVKVTAADHEGRPLDVEFSLGAVDESIYAIMPESTQDIRAAFYGRRYSGVNTQSSFWFYTYGDEGVEMPMAEMSMDMAGGAPEMRTMAKMAAPSPAGGEMVQPEIRSDFPDTAYWMANIETGENGAAEISFKVPDTLTTWRLTSRGVSRDTHVGQTVHKVISTKNVIVRLQTPRFFTQGDEQNITAVVHNYLDKEKNVQTILNVKGLRLLEKNEKLLKVPAGADVRVEWRAVVESPQDAWVTVKALTDEESDAMQLTIPVLPHGSPGGDAAAGELVAPGENEDTFTLDLPGTYLKGTQKLTVSISPSLTSGVFDVLEYLAGYPYGCVEQTMSRFLPDVVIAELLQRAGRPMEGKLVELPEMVADGLARLGDMQHNDGGWGWWKDDETHPYMTAYVVMGLEHARRADFPVTQQMIERGGEALKAMLKKDKFENYDDDDIWNTKAYMIYALAESGVDAEQLAENVYKKRERLNDYGKAVLSIAFSRMKKKDRALALIRELEKSAKTSATSARWEGKSFRYGWSDNVVETSAFVLMAMIDAEPKNELVTKAVRYLNLSRRGDHWYSTKDTAVAIMALTKYMSKFEDPSPDYSYTVSVNGAEVKKGVMKKENISGESAAIEITEGLKTGKNEIRIAKKGKGSLYHFSSLRYFEGADRLSAQDNGIKVERWYSSDPEGKKRLKDGAKVKSGGVIWSHVKLDPRGAYDYVMVEDYLPSGFEVDKNEAAPGLPVPYRFPYYYVNREIRDEKVVVFYTRMWGNDYHTATPLKAEVPGKVSAMPCRAELMYFPEVGGRSAEMRFEVKE